MNQNNSQEQVHVRQITPEELQKTLVLNLQEVEEVVKYEKKTSKKPAIILAVIGIISIIFGSTYPMIQSFTSKNNVKSNVEKRTNPSTDVEKNTIKDDFETLTCYKSSYENPDKTDQDISINYEFKNNKLTHYMTMLNVTPMVTETPESAKQIVAKYTAQYQPYLINSIGYMTNISSSDTSFMLTVDVDINELMTEELNPIISQNEITKIEFTKDTTKEQIIASNQNKGYICS